VSIKGSTFSVSVVASGAIKEHKCEAEEYASDEEGIDEEWQCRGSALPRPRRRGRVNYAEAEADD
jgi:hypothetical protein